MIFSFFKRFSGSCLTCSFAKETLARDIAPVWSLNRPLYGILGQSGRIIQHKALAGSRSVQPLCLDCFGWVSNTSALQRYSTHTIRDCCRAIQLRDLPLDFILQVSHINGHAFLLWVPFLQAVDLQLALALLELRLTKYHR